MTPKHRPLGGVRSHHHNDGQDPIDSRKEVNQKKASTRKLEESEKSYKRGTREKQRELV